MPYSPTTWQDRVVQYPARYSKTGETTSEVTLTASPGTVTQAGTPLNATNMNKIESGISAALPRDGSAAMTGQLKTIAGTRFIPSIVSTLEDDTGIFFPAVGELSLVSNSRMAITLKSDATNAYVGINNAFPDYIFDVRSSLQSSGSMDFTRVMVGTSSFIIGISDGVLSNATWRIKTGSTQPLAFSPGGTDQIKILVDGSTQFTAAGSQTLPTITNSADTNTGIYWSAADKLGFTEGGKGITLDELKMMGSMGGML